MPNRSKTERNAEIVRLYDNMNGLLQREIAIRMGMTEGAVSMVIRRDKQRKQQRQNKIDGKEVN